MYLRCLLSLALLVPAVALAQSQTTVRSDQGDQGAELGKQLLEQAPTVTHDPTGGERGAGTLIIEGIGTIGINEIVPGADRSKIDELSQRASRVDRGNAETAGAAALRGGLEDQTSTGAALRVMVTSESMSESELAGDEGSFWENTARAVQAGGTGSLQDVFSDCRDEVEIRQGPSIVIETRTEFTCEENEDNSPRCGRQREVMFAEIGRSEERVIVFDQTIRVSNRGGVVGYSAVGLAGRMTYRGNRADVRIDGELPTGVEASVEDPSEANGWQGTIVFSSAPLVDCPAEAAQPPGTKCPPTESTTDVSISAEIVFAPGDWYEERIVEGPGTCLLRYAQEFGCPLKFECASELATLDGQTMTASLAQRLGLAPLYAEGDRLEGAREIAACAIAEAVPFCTVCANDDDNSNCVVPDVRRAQGRTCSALESDATCVEQGSRSCILYDELNPSRCVAWSRTFMCTEREATVPEVISSVRNSCDLPEVACSRDGCRRQADLAGDSEAMSLQKGLAGLAVAQAMTTDITEVPKSGRASPAAPVAPAVSEGYAWGYDQDDGEGFDDAAQDSVSSAPIDAEAIDTSGIQIFRGEAFSCKKALGGLIRCCQPTRTDANQRYWNIFDNINRGALAGQLMSRQGPSTGSWAALAGGGSLNALSQSLTSGRENVLGGGSGGATGEQGSMQEIHDRFMTEARSQIRPNLSPSWACSQKEFDLAVQREIGNCSYAGTFCRRRVFGVCLEKRESYCCYSSPMSKHLRAHADGGVIQHGSARNPNCGGISLERMATIDWDSLDVTPIVGNMAAGNAFPSGPEQGSGAIDRFTGSGSTAGGSNRVNVVDRSGDRLGAIDADGAFRDIRSEAEGYVQRPAVDITGPAVLSFGTTYHVGRPGSVARLIITRVGPDGAASSVVGVTAGESAVDALEGATQTWPPGDVDPRILRVRIADDAIPGTQILIKLTSDSELGAVTTATLEVIE